MPLVAISLDFPSSSFQNPYYGSVETQLTLINNAFRPEAGQGYERILEATDSPVPLLPTRHAPGSSLVLSTGLLFTLSFRCKVKRLGHIRKDLSLLNCTFPRKRTRRVSQKPILLPNPQKPLTLLVLGPEASFPQLLPAAF